MLLILRLRASLLTLTLMLLGGGVALGEGRLDGAKRAEAKQRFDAGSKLYNLRSYEKALEEFKAVYLLVGDPSLLFNIGQCERQLERYVDARKSFQSYLREAQPTEEQRRDIERLIASVDAAIRNAEESKKVEAAQIQPATPTVAPTIAAAPVQAPMPKKSKAWIVGVALGGVVVVGLAVGLGVGLGLPSKYPTPTDGTINGN